MINWQIGWGRQQPTYGVLSQTMPWIFLRKNFISFLIRTLFVPDRPTDLSESLTYDWINTNECKYLNATYTLRQFRPPTAGYIHPIHCEEFFPISNYYISAVVLRKCCYAHTVCVMCIKTTCSHMVQVNLNQSVSQTVTLHFMSTFHAIRSDVQVIVPWMKIWWSWDLFNFWNTYHLTWCFYWLL